MTTELTSDPLPDDETPDDDFDDPMLRLLAAAPAVPFGEVPLPPDTIVAQNYRIHRKVGAGAMGVVYEATDLVLARRVALKVHEMGRSDREARMWREARALARVADPNVVAVHEVGVDGSRGFIAMELVAGNSARQWLRSAPRSWQEIVEVYRQAGRGLAAVHHVGVVHRDFKPDNLLVGADGRVRVADFGLAIEPNHQVEVTALELRPVARGVTRTGVRAGTPAYMAPEQRSTGLADARSDQYAFCVALHEALHGARPNDTAAAPTTAATTKPPAWVDAAIARGLAVEPAARYPDMHALVAALDPAPRQRRRTAWIWAIGAVASGAILLRAGSWWASAPDQPQPCAAAGAAIDETWSAERASVLERTLADGPDALVQDAVATLVPGFDAWADQWRTAARDACESTYVFAQQSAVRLDERNDCLERARGRFAATIALYDEPAADAMARATEIVGSLPDVSMCARGDAGIVTDAISPERATAYGQLLALLDRAAAEVVAGRTAAAKASLDAVITGLEAERAAVALGEARRLRGEVLLEMGRRNDAIAELSVSVELGHRNHDRDALAVAMTALARALGRSKTDRDESARLLSSARAIAEDLGWSAGRRLGLDLAELELAFWSERYDDVDALAKAVLDDPSIDDAGRVRVMSLAATSLDRRGRFAEAIAAHDDVLALVERVRGPAHPQVAMVLANRATTRQSTSDDDADLQALGRALAIRIAAYGPDAPIVGELHRQLGDAELARGHHDAATRAYERAIAIGRAAGDDTGLYFALANRSRVFDDEEDYEASARVGDEVIAIAKRHFGKDSLELARALVNRGLSRFYAGEYAVGAAEVERALTIMVGELPNDDLGLATARLSLSRFHARLGRGQEAMAMFDAAARVVLASFPDDHERHVAFALNRAMMLDLVGRTADAIAQWRATGELVERSLTEDSPLRAEILRDLGARLIDAGERAEARDVLRRARSIDSRYGKDPERTASIAALLARLRG